MLLSKNLTATRFIVALLLVVRTVPCFGQSEILVDDAARPVESFTSDPLRTGYIRFSSFEFQRPYLGREGPGFTRLHGQPSAGAQYVVKAVLYLQQVVATAKFELVDESGRVIQLLHMSKSGPGHGPYPELPPLPEIDFSREMVVVAAMGRRPSTSYAIIIDSAYERNDYRLEVVVRSVENRKGCMAMAMMTAPIDIVRLPKTERSVIFREIEVVPDCQ